MNIEGLYFKCGCCLNRGCNPDSLCAHAHQFSYTTGGKIMKLGDRAKFQCLKVTGYSGITAEYLKTHKCRSKPRVSQNRVAYIFDTAKKSPTLECEAH